MVLKLIGPDLKKSLDRNALLMGIFGLIFSFLSSASLEKNTSLARLMGLEGLALLFFVFALEFSKGTLQEDKARNIFLGPYFFQASLRFCLP